MTAGWFEAICAGVTLLILWSVTVIGGTVWLSNRLTELKDEIIQDFDKKHAANQTRYDALNTIVIRHDTILNPEWRSAYQQHGTGE